MDTPFANTLQYPNDLQAASVLSAATGAVSTNVNFAAASSCKIKVMQNFIPKTHVSKTWVFVGEFCVFVGTTYM